MADRAGTFFHGLHHEIRNLQAVAKEALGLGRLLVLGAGPRLNTAHNMGVKPTLLRWEDYLSLQDTRFAVFDKQNQRLCSGVLADCVVAGRQVPAGYGGAPKRFDDVADVPANDPTAVVVRDYGSEAQHANARFAAYGNFDIIFGPYFARLQLQPTPHALSAVFCFVPMLIGC